MTFTFNLIKNIVEDINNKLKIVPYIQLCLYLQLEGLDS